MSTLYAKMYKKTAKKDIINWKLGVDKWNLLVPRGFVLSSKKPAKTALNISNDFFNGICNTNISMLIYTHKLFVVLIRTLGEI